MESDFLSAGYFLARSRRGQLSASTCLCDFFPDTWAIRWTNDTALGREEKAARFGLGPAQFETATEWATGAFQEVFGWPNVFYSLEAAQAARADFLPPDAAVTVFGLGLHCDDAVDFLKAAAPEPPKPGCSPAGEMGIYECVKARRAIADGGRRAGFELVSTLFAIVTCSWLCNGLEMVCADQLGVNQNEHGLISEYGDARRSAEYVARDNVGAEPGLWLPWLITVYSI